MKQYINGSIGYITYMSELIPPFWRDIWKLFQKSGINSQTALRPTIYVVRNTP